MASSNTNATLVSTTFFSSKEPPIEDKGNETNDPPHSSLHSLNPGHRVSIRSLAVEHANALLKDHTVSNSKTERTQSVRSLTRPETAQSRYSTSFDFDEKMLEDWGIIDHEEVLEYGFGCPFSYWKEYKYYEYVAPKYDNLKYELLNNTIQTVSQKEWDQIYNKAHQKIQIIDTILGQNNDKNTAFAHSDKQWNTIMNIAPRQKISLHHVLSVLFYTDLTDLPREMKSVCRKLNKNESISDVKKRHSELIHWLRLLFETILLYGSRLSVNRDLLLYHGLDRKFYFNEFKAKFAIPTSTTSECAIALNFAHDSGITLVFGGIESVGDPYFSTQSLSNYPDEKEYIFFFAELPIKTVYINMRKFDMSSLSLFQSIVSGNIIIDKVQSENKKRFQKTQKKLNELLLAIENESKSDDKYDEDSLRRFLNKIDRIWINSQDIISAIGLKPLRERFIQQNDDKSFKGYSSHLLNLQNEGKIKINNATHFTWNISFEEINDFLNNDKTAASKGFKCSNEATFYCQMHRRSDGIMARISLVIYKLPKVMNGQITISFDLYCKNMKHFYSRFHHIVLYNNDQDSNASQGIDFKLDLLRDSKIIKKKKAMEWQISVRTI